MTEKQVIPEDPLKTKLADMSADLVKEAKVIIKDNLEKHTNEKDIAYYIKREYPNQFYIAWTVNICLVGIVWLVVTLDYM